MRFKGLPQGPNPYPHVRKIGFLNWQWSITDGETGPFMVAQHRALTGRAARRHVQDAKAKLKMQGLA